MKCVTLSLMLVSCAYGVQPTQLKITWGLVQAGVPSTFWAKLGPGEIWINEGTISFTSNGEPVEGCTALPVQMNQATCRIAFPKAAPYPIEAAYSGSPYWAASGERAVVPVGRLVAGGYIERNPKAPVYGNNLIVGALLLGPKEVTPTGTFTFFDNGREVGNVPLVEDPDAAAASGLSAARAELNVVLPAGVHSIQATYAGDDRYSPARTPAMMFAVAKRDPLVVIYAPPANVSQSVTVKASVMAPKPTGTVSFERMPGCGNVPIDEAGAAYCTTTYTYFGDFPVTAKYSGDANLTPGDATAFVKVTKATAGMYLAKSPENPVYGQAVRISGLVMGAPGLSPPVGSVLFSDGSRTGASGFDAEGRASWTAALPAGTHQVTAKFSGDMYYAASEGALEVVVERAKTAVALESTAAGAYTARVSAIAPGSGTPTGSVRFLREGASAAVVPLTGTTASFTTSAPGLITAEYLGDANFLPGYSASSLAKPAAAVTLASNRNPGMPGQSVTLTATVAPGPGTAAPAGTVQFTSDGVLLAAVGLIDGRATIATPFAAGSHTIVASYSGDAVYPAASGTLTQVVTAVQAGLGLSASVPGAVYGQAVTFTAQVAATAATGTVRFLDGGAVAGSAPLADGKAAVTVASLTAGVHRIVAEWAGDSTYGAASAEMAYTVARASTAVSVTLGTGAAAARVAVVAPGAGTPAGRVRFIDGISKAEVAAGALAGGSATVVLGGLTGPVVAVYDGDPNFAGSVSAAVSPMAAANAASYAAETVAPDEIVTLFGPMTAGITTAKVTDSNGDAHEAEVLYSGPGQATVAMPSRMAMGPAVLTAGWWSAAVTVGWTAPGVFTADGSGKGAPAGVAGPVEAGAPLVLYGTGLRHASAKPVCTIGGEPVEVLFAGAQGAYPGLDQVNLFVPESLRGMGAAVLDLVVDGVAANRVSVVIR